MKHILTIRKEKVKKKKNNNKRAFTLAEVLITLGIIGVVAVMTIPNLVTDIQEKEWATASDTFIKKLEAAMKVMNTEDVLTGYETTEEFASELSRYFKINNVCQNTELNKCFSETIVMGDDKTKKVTTNDMTTSSKIAAEGWGTNTVGIQFANGTTGILAYNPECSANPHDVNANVLDCIALLYDVSGFQKPNSVTKDIRTTSNISVSAFGNLCLVKFNGVCITKTIFIPTPVSREECVLMAQSGKYGNIPGCYNDPDYWAGAIKECGGVDNLPTLGQLFDIAKAVYDCGNDCSSEEGKDIIANRNFGSFSKITGGSSGPVTIMSNEWVQGAWVKYVYYQGSYYRSNRTGPSSGQYYICVGE